MVIVSKQSMVDRPITKLRVNKRHSIMNLRQHHTTTVNSTTKPPLEVTLKEVTHKEVVKRSRTDDIHDLHTSCFTTLPNSVQYKMEHRTAINKWASIRWN